MDAPNAATPHPEIEVRGKHAYVPTSALFAFLFTVIFWMLDALVWVLRYGSDGRFPDRPRALVCTGLTVLFTLWILLEGKERRRVAMLAMTGGKEIALRPGQMVLVVVVLILFSGVFCVWVMNSPDPVVR